MPRPRDPFSAALESLRERTMRGVYAPGVPVVIIEEARRLGLSTTPVREALAWLCGEGLLERAPRAGYLAPRLDASLLRDRYWVRMRCLATSLDLIFDLGEPPPAGAMDGPNADAVHELFSGLVRATGNRALVETFERVDAQLRMINGAEQRLFRDFEDEARDLVRIDAQGSRSQLLSAIDAYHRRRMGSAALIVIEVERRGRLRSEGG